MRSVREDRTWRPGKLELQAQEAARRKADRQARHVRWERLLKARIEYVRLHAFALWVRAIVDAEGDVPAWPSDILDERCPGFWNYEKQSRDAHPEQEPFLWLQLSEWVDANIFHYAKREGWLGAITFYAARDPAFSRDWAYWEYCDREWRQQRPPRYPSFEDWRRASEDCGEEMGSLRGE